jgi:DUF971 family protein
MSPTPKSLNLKRTESLEIVWSDDRHSTYSISLLRTMCPCAQCRIVRTGTDPHSLTPQQPKKSSLTILPGNFSEPLSVLHAELVGNYALRIDWSDQHNSGIYSFAYLRELDSERKLTTDEHG